MRILLLPPPKHIVRPIMPSMFRQMERAFSALKLTRNRQHKPVGGKLRHQLSALFGFPLVPAKKQPV
jgi:hypothetical protein